MIGLLGISQRLRTGVRVDALNKKQENTLNTKTNKGWNFRNLSFSGKRLVDYPTMDDRLSNEVLKSSDRMKQEIKTNFIRFLYTVGR